MGLSGGDVKSCDPGPGLSTTVTGAEAGARMSIGGARASIGCGGVTAIGKSVGVGVTAKPTLQSHNPPSNRTDLERSNGLAVEDWLDGSRLG